MAIIVVYQAVAFLPPALLLSLAFANLFLKRAPLAALVCAVVPVAVVRSLFRKKSLRMRQMNTKGFYRALGGVLCCLFSVFALESAHRIGWGAVNITLLLWGLLHIPAMVKLARAFFIVAAIEYFILGWFSVVVSFSASDQRQPLFESLAMWQKLSLSGVLLVACMTASGTMLTGFNGGRKKI